MTRKKYCFFNISQLTTLYPLSSTFLYSLCLFFLPLLCYRLFSLSIFHFWDAWGCVRPPGVLLKRGWWGWFWFEAPYELGQDQEEHFLLFQVGIFMIQFSSIILLFSFFATTSYIWCIFVCCKAFQPKVSSHFNLLLLEELVGYNLQGVVCATRVVSKYGGEPC